MNKEVKELLADLKEKRFWLGRKQRGESIKWQTLKKIKLRIY